MTEKLRRYEKIDFLGEGQVSENLIKFLFNVIKIFILNFILVCDCL